MLFRDARAYALSLPEAEQIHHGMPSFRVRGKIFATLLDADHIRVMAGETEILAAVAEDSSNGAARCWGNRLACVVVGPPGPAPHSADRSLVAKSPEAGGAEPAFRRVTGAVAARSACMRTSARSRHRGIERTFNACVSHLST